MTNEREEMLEKSATLYFGPWYRKSPMFEATRRAGCTAYDIYNHMYLPGLLRRPRDRVLRAQQRRDALGRGRGADGGGERTRCRPPDRHDHVPRPHEVCGGPGQVHAGDRPRRRHRERPGAPARRAEHVVDAARGLRRRSLRARRGLANSGLDAEVTLPDVHPVQVQGPKAVKTLQKLVGRDPRPEVLLVRRVRDPGHPGRDQPDRVDRDPGVRGEPARSARGATSCGTRSSRPARSSTSVRSRRARPGGSRPASSTTAPTSRSRTRRST